MKTKFLSLGAVLLISQLMMAQFHLGIKAGANISKVDGKSFKEEFRYGYNVGGFAEIKLGGKFSLQPEVLFNQYSTVLTRVRSSSIIFPFLYYSIINL